MGRACSMHRAKRNASRIFVPEGRRPHGKLRHGWRIILKGILER
jgi:hypothetical protein